MDRYPGEEDPLFTSFNRSKTLEIAGMRQIPSDWGLDFLQWEEMAAAAEDANQHRSGSNEEEEERAASFLGRRTEDGFQDVCNSDLTFDFPNSNNNSTSRTVRFLSLLPS